MDPAAADDEAAVLSKLHATRSNLVALLAASSDLNNDIAAVSHRISLGFETVAAASDAIAPLQTQSITAKALHSRINRAVSPAFLVLHSFALAESLQRRLLSLSDDTSAKPHLARLLKYVDCVDRLNAAIGAVTAGCEPAVVRLQEAVEFLRRTKATDQLKLHRLRETLGAIKALYEAEVDSMRYEGPLDEALMRLQDEYEGILQQIRHEGIGEADGGGGDNAEMDGSEQRKLGSELEVEVLGRISETLASNDCLDICIDIYVKVRYRRTAKALMRLNPRYLKTYAPEEIDKMDWEVLESAITLWIEHFQLAVKIVFVAEKQLCKQVLSGVMDGAIWPECFVKIADKIMAVFFRFGEGVARSSKEPQKLFKLLDMYDSMDRIRTEFALVFDGESGIDIRARFRELQKLLVHAASKVFWEFGLQIEGLQDGAPPPPDGSVPKIVRYAVNYLKCLAGNGFAAAMGQVLRTEQMWKAGYLSRPEQDESLLREAISNTLDALQRNVESKRSRYRDKVLPHVLAMNTYWYMYMRTKGSELAKLVGEETMKKKYKTAAEEAAYSYQAQAWGPLVKLLEKEETGEEGREESGALAGEKMELFMREFDENLRRHQSSYCIPDTDLREQIKQAVAKLVVPAYAGFLRSYSGVMHGRSFLPPDSIRELLGRFSGGEAMEERASVTEDGRVNFRRREFRHRVEERVEGEGGEEGERTLRRRENRKEGEGSFRRREEKGGGGGGGGGGESFGRNGGKGSLGKREERGGGRGTFGKREEKKGGGEMEEEGEKFVSEERGRFGRRGEGRGGSFDAKYDKKEAGSFERGEKEETITSLRNREFKIRGVEENTRINFARREFKNQEEAEGVEEGKEGAAEQRKREIVGGGMTNIRRREFKTRVRR